MARAIVDTDELVRDLERIVGDKRVSVRETDLDTYARDMWPRLLIALRHGGDPSAHRPHAVVWPESTREIAAIVRLARARAVPVVPYGGGSGVCGGAVPVCGGISMDLKRMDRLDGVRGDEMLCDVQAGMNGERFERELCRRGYTFGNFPSSIYCSTVGGWLATRAAGQMSTKYGKVEDRVAGVTVVTGRGDVIQTDELARASRGPNWTQLVLGSEGILGVITSARLRVSPAPRLRMLRGYEFDSVRDGVEAIRRVMQRGLRPAVVRLYDEFDSFMNAWKRDDGDRAKGVADADRDDRLAPLPSAGTGALPAMPGADADDSRRGGRGLLSLLGGVRGGRGRLGRVIRQQAMAAALRRPRLLNRVVGGLADRMPRVACKLIVGVEGARIRTEVEARLTFSELERAGGRDLGEDVGRDWLAHRYAISYRMSPMFRDGVFVDTIEVASSWEQLMDLYATVRAAIGQHALVMAHFSHAYHEGCSIYFTFAGHGDDARDAQRIYDAVWRDAMAATSRAGGTISHHHGVGLLKAPYMRGEHREAMAILRALKHALDPDGIMNPGKLGLGDAA
jgi:alkyldihydroxyacetonephosphate synthase